MIINKFKRKNLIEVDDQTLFILRVATNANNKGVENTWTKVKEGDIIKQLVDENLVPRDDNLYHHVIHLVRWDSMHR